MRLTGHHRDEIAQAIKEAAPAIRPGEMRDWEAYAKRTATVAFGVPGDRLAEYLRRQGDRLRGLEGAIATSPNDCRLAARSPGLDSDADRALPWRRGSPFSVRHGDPRTKPWSTR
jgi:hypothetical protein